MEDRFAIDSRMPATPAAPPAVGEKNKEDCDRCAGAPAKDFEDLPIGAAFKWSRDMVEFAPTTLYIPRFLPGTADMDFISATLWAIAARLTERCSDQATRLRHTSTAAPKNARTAPTQIKTVPSGRLDFCMKGAPAVSGTLTSGIPTPASVGAPTRLKTLVDAACAVVGVAEDEAACEVAAWLLSGAEEAGVLEGAVLFAAAPSGCETVAKSGAPWSWPSAVGATASSRPTRPTEQRIFDGGIMVCAEGGSPLRRVQTGEGHPVGRG